MNSRKYWTPGTAGAPTRYPELTFAQVAPGQWQLLCRGGWGGNDWAQIGPAYASKAELLADLDRYARFYGCSV